MADVKRRTEPCSTNGFFSVVGLVGIGLGFGWRYAALAVVVDSCIDYYIRMWHHNIAVNNEAALRARFPAAGRESVADSGCEASPAPQINK